MCYFIYRYIYILALIFFTLVFFFFCWGLFVFHIRNNGDSITLKEYMYCVSSLFTHPQSAITDVILVLPDPVISRNLSLVSAFSLHWSKKKRLSFYRLFYLFIRGVMAEQAFHSFSAYISDKRCLRIYTSREIDIYGVDMLRCLHSRPTFDNSDLSTSNLGVDTFHKLSFQIGSYSSI